MRDEDFRNIRYTNIISHYRKLTAVLYIASSERNGRIVGGEDSKNTQEQLRRVALIRVQAVNMSKAGETKEVRDNWDFLARECTNFIRYYQPLNLSHAH